MANEPDVANRTPRLGCDICSGTIDDSAPWIEVHPEGEGISLVAVDVTLRLCPEHRRRLLEALGRRDADHVEPPSYQQIK